MAKKPTTLSIDPLKRGRVTAQIIGTTPMFMNSMSAKAQRTLLLGGGKKTAAQKKNEVKHQPHEEYRSSMYLVPDGPTLLGFPAAGVKASMATAALETAGVTKTSVNRLIFLPQERIPVWGVPQLRMDVVRSADMNKTPDIRTRAYLPQWCAEVEIAYVQPTLSQTDIAALLTNAGVVCGLGDFRQEKGKGSFGTFRLREDTPEDNALWEELTASGGREAQQAARDNPAYANADTEELMAFWTEEMAKRDAA